MTGAKRVLLLVGSPRGKRSTSTVVGSYLLNLLTENGLESLKSLWIGPVLKSQEKTEQMLKAVDEADIIVLVAPLYDDCQPYIVIKAMEL
ncbi:MAG: NAD(P)H-dependent oxidoreductase, partial [Candidatus Aminicenantes bacterium]|nr:NAD(P)H-dependent oxidoreductase [Candidatus Aminicenantes bacterium]